MPLQLTNPTPTSTRVLRSFDAPRHLIWRAHTEAELLRRWMTGPPTHSLKECSLDPRVGGKGRFVWKGPEFEMGMDLVLLEVEEPTRMVHTEEYEGWPEGKCTATSIFAEDGAGTTLTVELQYQSQEARDAAMQPGFAEGYEASFAQLDALIPELQAQR